MDNAIDVEAARTKGVTSLVAGRAEVLVVPNLESGNMLAKELAFVGHAETAGLVVGAKVPVILTSRADDVQSRLASCALAVAYSTDWWRAEEILGASGTLVRVNGTGAIIGPLLTAALMALIGTSLFFWTISGLFGTVAAFILWRMLVRDALPQERQRRWVPYPARASAVAANLIPRRRRNEKGIPSGPPINR